MEEIGINNTGWQASQAKASNSLMVQSGGIIAKTDTVKQGRNMDEKQRRAKDKLDLEIFNHYFLGFSGNG